MSSRWNHFNILHTEGDQRYLWQFEHDGDGVAVAAQRQCTIVEPLPAGMVRKGWSNFWQPAINVAWLPTNQVFLRVVQLPACEPSELPAMVEFQLEKLSPLALGQIVWTAEPLPSPEGQAQTVIVVIAARNAVEDYLAGLEGVGYLADRLELPCLQELLASGSLREGVRIYARRDKDQLNVLLAWWNDGRLQNLNLLNLTATEAAGLELAEAFKQVVWAGEMEGWLSTNLACQVVAEPEVRAMLEPALAHATPGGITAANPPPFAEVAARSAGGRSTGNLIPPDFAARYRQQYIDRLWMRGLAALGLVYLVGLVIYFGALKVVEFQKAGVDREIKTLAQQYNSALQLKARLQVLQDQFSLKYAALDCWKAAAENLPEEMTLSTLTFQRGKKLVLFGNVPADQQSKVTEYNAALSKATINGQPVFSQVNTRSIVAPPGAGRPANWSIDCDIKRTEVE